MIPTGKKTLIAFVPNLDPRRTSDFLLYWTVTLWSYVLLPLLALSTVLVCCFPSWESVHWRKKETIFQEGDKCTTLYRKEARIPLGADNEALLSHQNAFYLKYSFKMLCPVSYFVHAEKTVKISSRLRRYRSMFFLSFWFIIVFNLIPQYRAKSPLKCILFKQLIRNGTVTADSPAAGLYPLKILIQPVSWRSPGWGAPSGWKAMAGCSQHQNKLLKKQSHRRTSEQDGNICN